MNIFKKHIEYLKDNPEGYWFKRKLYGYGWTPAKPAGWVVSLGYVLVVVGIIGKNEAGFSQDNLVVIVLATVVFFIILWKTGESPKWQWGNKTEIDKKDK
jgi:hypothetical protein